MKWSYLLIGLVFIVVGFLYTQESESQDFYDRMYRHCRDIKPIPPMPEDINSIEYYYWSHAFTKQKKGCRDNYETYHSPFFKGVLLFYTGFGCLFYAAHFHSKMKLII